MSDTEVVTVDINSLTYAEGIFFEEHAGLTIAEFADRSAAASVDSEKVERLARRKAKASSTKKTKAHEEEAYEELLAKTTPFYPTTKMMAALAYVTMRRSDPEIGSFEEFLDRQMGDDLEALQLSAEPLDPTEAASSNS